MKIYSYDDSPRTKRMSELLEKGLPEWVETVRLFPIPTTRDGKTVCFKAQVAMLRRQKDGIFAPGRFA